MTTSTDYRTSSRAMMAQSQDELAKGDLQQASDKGWGAAAQMMKAIAESRGWEHGQHRHLHQITSRLRAESFIVASDTFRKLLVPAISDRRRPNPRRSTMPAVVDKPRIQCRYWNADGWQCPLNALENK